MAAGDRQFDQVAHAPERRVDRTGVGSGARGRTGSRCREVGVAQPVVAEVGAVPPLVREAQGRRPGAGNRTDGQWAQGRDPVGVDASEHPYPQPRARAQAPEVRGVREGGMPVGRGQPDGRPRTVAGVDPGQHPFAVGGDDLHVAPGQRRGVPGPVGGGRGRETGPGASGGERGPDAGLREQAAVRGDDGPGDDQTSAGQPFVIAQEGPEGDVGGAGAAGSLRSPRCDVAEGVPAAGVVDEMGQDTAQGTGSGDRFPADAVEAQRPVGAVVVVGGADQAGVGVGRLQTVGDEEELPQGGDRPGGPLDPVGTLRVARVAQVAYDVEGRVDAPKR
ncbi:hypothetical protein [Streptomyces sp. LRa12]|uniref:hypothetical protein n=1 Tax=Streptomyces sp. LRa12 TaxID=2563107 RepID=UPI001446C6A2|nr:hypothetical protein [Streptomyces sp. LRa12]